MVNRFLLLVVFATLISGCPRNIPQPEIDAAERSIAEIENIRDCDPDKYKSIKKGMKIGLMELVCPFEKRA